MKTPYEGTPVRDGTYTLGQLSKSGYGRVVIPGTEPDNLLYEDMPVAMNEVTFDQLFNYVKTRGGSIHQFNAVVVDNEIIHVY